MSPAQKVRTFLVSRINRRMWRTIAIFLAYALVSIPDWFRIGIGPFQALPISFLESIFLAGLVLAISLTMILSGHVLSRLRHRALSRRLSAWSANWLPTAGTARPDVQITRNISASPQHLLVR